LLAQFGLHGVSLLDVGRSSDLLDSVVEDPPSALILVGEDGACRGEVGGVVDQLGRRMQVARRRTCTGEVFAQRG
jgi:hypothetical protein